MLFTSLTALLEPRNLLVSSVIAVGGLLIVALTKPAYLPQQSNHLISRVIHNYLCWRYPIKDSSGRHPIPTSPYVWPNGQGDVGKFLEGIENSVSWEKEHGQVYRIWSGMRSEVVLTRPEHLQAVFNDSDKHFKAVNNNSGYIMSQLLGKCVGLVSGEEWRSLREVTEVPFVHRNTSAYIGMINDHIERHFANLSKQGNLTQGLLHPAEDLKMLPFWIIAEIIYGKLSPALVAELLSLSPLREELFKYVIQGGLSRFSWTHFFPTEAGKALLEFKSRWTAFNKAAYDNALASTKSFPETQPPPIVAMFSAVKAGTITHDQLHQTIDEALFANLDVTTGGISWNPVFLAANPAYQPRLRTEIQSLEPGPKPLESYLQSSSTLLASCITESSRLKPLAAFSVPQSAPSDREVGGYVIPAGTNFIVDSYALNVRNESFWGADTATYRPDRFSEPRMRKTKLRYHFWRFGFGPRQCMGKYVADLIIRQLVVFLVQRFDLHLVGEGRDWERSRESWITHPDFLIGCVRRKESEIVSES